MSTHSLNLWGVLSETSRIINAHSRHFLALSVLFLLPISFSSIIYPSLLQPTVIHSHYRRSLLSFSTPDPEIPPVDKSQFLFPILYQLFVLVFSICSSVSITYSTFNGFNGRPVKFISSVKSILFSFFPLLATLFATQIILGLIIFAFGGFMFLVYYGLTILGVEMAYDSVSFLVFGISIAALLVGMLIYLGVEWFLSNVVVVVESQWGFAPLKRSSHLVKGMRSVVVSMILLLGILFGLLAMFSSRMVANAGGFTGGLVSWEFVFQMVLLAGIMTLVSLYSVAANTVLFMHCKALHGELAFGIAEEFAQAYVILPFDDGKVPHAVNVV